MILASFFLPLDLASFNEMEAARGRVAAARGSGDRTRQNAYNEEKRRAQHDCVVHFLAARTRPHIPNGDRVRVRLTWHALDRRTDPDNIASAKKIILDALARTRGKCVGAGIIHCDGWHCVAGFADDFVHEISANRRGVRVELEAAA